MIRRALTAQIGDVAAGAFLFHALGRDRIVATLLQDCSVSDASDGVGRALTRGKLRDQS